MAYVKKSRIFRLTWADGDLEGLEVRIRSMPVGELMELGPLIDGFSGMDLTGVTAEDVEHLRRPFAVIAEKIVSWNIELEDETTGDVVPVPVTVEGLMSLDPPELEGILSEWVKAMTSVKAPLGLPSTDGGNSLEASIPMEPPSPNH